jgi:hypothetical protein
MTDFLSEPVFCFCFAVLGIRLGLEHFFFFYSYVHTMFGSFLPPSPILSILSKRAPLGCISRQLIFLIVYSLAALFQFRICFLWNFEVAALSPSSIAL